MNATVSEEGQVTIPIALRQRLGNVPGSPLAFAIDAEPRYGQCPAGASRFASKTTMAPSCAASLR